MTEEAIVWRPHSDKQARAMESAKRVIAVLTGIQWGKTDVGSIKTIIACYEFTSAADNFLITAPTYKILKQSTLPPFLRRMDGRGHYDKAEEKFVIHGGGTVFFRTATDPDSIVGITNIRFIWADEAGLYPLYFWENIQARAAFKQAQICITSSPYALNWVYKDIILPKMKDKEALPDVELIQARSDENPYFPKSEYERQQATMDARRFRMMYGGAWEKMEGLVYDCWDDEENTIDSFSLPSGTQYFGGIDWGHTHPFVLLVRAVTPTGQHYQVSEFYKTRLTIRDMIDIARSKMTTWGIERFYCGPDRPENIEEFCRAGIPAVASRNDVQLGIDLHYELIKSRQYKIFAGSSPYTVDEYNKYHWPSEEELDSNKDDKERNPVKQDDDCMDCNRYLTLMTWRGTEKRMPKTPIAVQPQSVQDRLKALKRGNLDKRKTEVWS